MLLCDIRGKLPQGAKKPVDLPHFLVHKMVKGIVVLIHSLVNACSNNSAERFTNYVQNVLLRNFDQRPLTPEKFVDTVVRLR